MAHTAATTVVTRNRLTPAAAGAVGEAILIGTVLPMSITIGAATLLNMDIWTTLQGIMTLVPPVTGIHIFKLLVLIRDLFTLGEGVLPLYLET